MTTNNFRGVPWMVAGARHAAELGRGVAHAASGGGSGVSVPGDLKVTAKATPTTKVDIAPGSAFIPNRAAGVRAQSYLAQQDVASELDGPSAVNGARSYLVLVAIKDPQYPGGTIYNDADDKLYGPYVFPELYGPVPNTVTRVEQVPALDGKSVYAPARIDMPANTTTVLPEHIVDLRKLVQPRSHTEVMSKATINWFNAVDLETWKTWPDLGFSVQIPEWATHMAVKLDFSGILRSGGSIGAAIRGRIGTQIAGNFIIGNDVILEYDAGPGAAIEARESFMVIVDGYLPPAVRGSIATFGSEAKRLFVNEYPGYLREAGGGQVAGTIVFTEKVV